jgi:hypothetical protein
MTRKPRKSRPSRPARKPARRMRTRKMAKAPAADPLDAMIAAATCSLDLKIEPAWRPEIRAHLKVILRHGARVAQFALPDDAEPAPVFKA